MAKTGRPRLPTQTHKLRGSYKPSRHGDSEPMPPEGVMEPPAWVQGVAREQWFSIVPMLTGMGISSPVFSPALVLLVNSIGLYVEMEKHVGENGVSAIGSHGNPIASPEFNARNKAWEQVLKALREFGLTPSALTGVRKVDDGSSENNKSRFFDAG